MVRKLIIGLILVLAFSNPCFASLNDLLDATVGLRSINGSGTGFVIREDKDSLYILTAGHVISNSMSNMSVFLYSDVEESHSINSETLSVIHDVWSQSNDIALLKIAKKDFKGYKLPKPVKLAKTRPIMGDTTYSVGTPSGNWPTLFRTKTIVSNPNYLRLDMSIEKGRSGSGVFNKNEELVGVVIWSNGVCVCLDSIQNFLAEYDRTHPVQVDINAKNDINKQETVPPPADHQRSLWHYFFSFEAGLVSILFGRTYEGFMAST